MTSGEENPLVNYRFIVESGDLEPVSFTEVKMPDSEIEIIEYRDGSDLSRTVRKLPGLVRYSELILKRGMIM